MDTQPTYDPETDGLARAVLAGAIDDWERGRQILEDWLHDAHAVLADIRAAAPEYQKLWVPAILVVLQRTQTVEAEFVRRDVGDPDLALLRLSIRTLKIATDCAGRQRKGGDLGPGGTH